MSHAHHHPIHQHRIELYFALVCGALLLLVFLSQTFQWWTPIINLCLYLAAYFFGGWFTAKEAVEGIRHRQFDIDFLMLVAAFGAAALGEWPEGALLLFLFSLGHALEHLAMEKARQSIAALQKLAPATAFRQHQQGWQEVPVKELRIGDRVLIKPHTQIPADGLVRSGNSFVDQAPITGESIPVEKMATDLPIQQFAKANTTCRLFAGTLNGNGTLEMEVGVLPESSTLQKMIALVADAEQQPSPTQTFTKKVEKFYVPAVLLMVGLLLLSPLLIDESFSTSFYRAMSVLVGASPCALAISTPSAVLSGIARAARSGILFKGGAPLEALADVKGFAFDKTGTLTIGQPKVTAVCPFEGYTQAELLTHAAAVEQLSDHPLAEAIVAAAATSPSGLPSPADQLEAIIGKGLKAIWNQHEIIIGNQTLFAESTILTKAQQQIWEQRLAQGETAVLVMKDRIPMGVIGIRDQVRPEAKQQLELLQQMGIGSMTMLTGDHPLVANAIAKELGITKVKGNLLPEEKLQLIDQLKKQVGKMAMVGDGVNDAPALARSDVGIAMGAAGSAVALETADIALMANSIGKLPFAVALSRKSKQVIQQNVFISLGMVFLLVPLTLLGLIPMGIAVVGHEGSTLLVVLNSLRLLATKEV